MKNLRKNIKILETLAETKIRMFNCYFCMAVNLQMTIWLESARDEVLQLGGTFKQPAKK